MSLCCSQGHRGHFKLSVCSAVLGQSCSEPIVSYIGKVCFYKLWPQQVVFHVFLCEQLERNSCSVCGSMLVWHFIFRRDIYITGGPQESSKTSVKTSLPVYLKILKFH